MSKATDSFATVGIHNGWQFAKANVMISYLPASGSGGWWQPSKWQVCRGGEHTDPEAGWRDHWRKTFTVRGRHEKAGRFEAAKAWASERYGIAEWAKTPYGDWMDAEFVTKRTAELKAAVKVRAAQSEAPWTEDLANQ